MKQPSEDKQAQLTSLHLRRDQIHWLEALEGRTETGQASRLSSAILERPNLRTYSWLLQKRPFIHRTLSPNRLSCFERERVLGQGFPGCQKALGAPV